MLGRLQVKFSCSNCRFWNDYEDFKGQCRRKSAGHYPYQDSQLGMIVDQWPHTRSQDWCGKWKGKKKDRK